MDQPLSVSPIIRAKNEAPPPMSRTRPPRLPDPDLYALQFYVQQIEFEYSKNEAEQDQRTLQILWREVCDYANRLNCWRPNGTELH